MATFALNALSYRFLMMVTLRLLPSLQEGVQTTLFILHLLSKILGSSYPQQHASDQGGVEAVRAFSQGDHPEILHARLFQRSEELFTDVYGYP